MIGKVALRREERIAAIVAAAWSLAQEHGIGGISLHALAREVGMRQPSLYSYFDSKNALYDAMFADGNRRLLERLDTLELPEDPRAALKVFFHDFVEFALDDPERSNLMFARVIPGFEPSAESYAYAEEVLNQVITLMHRAGVDDPGDVDCIVAIVAGVMDAQLSNDPKGDRWIRHLNRLVDLYVDDAVRRSNDR